MYVIFELIYNIMTKEKIVKVEKVFNWDELNIDDMEIKYSMIVGEKM